MLLRTALVSAALIISLPLPTPAHDIYSHLRDKKGAGCCDGQDCSPAFSRLTTRGVQMYVDLQWIDVPSELIQYRTLPGDRGETGGGHWCGSANELDLSNPKGVYVTRCAILPPQAASVQGRRHSEKPVHRMKCLTRELTKEGMDRVKE